MSHRTEHSRTTSRTPRVAVIGVGNPLLKDEGLGVHVVQALQKVPLPGKGELTIIDGGTCPDAFYLLPEGIDKLIVVDAARGGCEPGTIYRFTPQDIVFRRGAISSLHQLDLSASLEMIEYTELNPKDIVIIGVEPKEIDWGLEISPELRKKVPQIIDLIKKEIGGSSPLNRGQEHH